MSTTLSMKDPNPGIWFKFNENDPKSGDICLRVVNPEKMKEIRDQAIKKRVIFKHGQRFEIEDINENLYSKLLWDYSIKDWEGLDDEGGNEIECNVDNKVFLMNNHVGFANFVGDKITELSERYEKDMNFENENLLQGSGGSSTQTNRVAKSAKK